MANRQPESRMRKIKFPWVLILGSAVCAFVPFTFVSLTVNRPLTNLEVILLQGISTAAGVSASFVAGRFSVQAAANEFLRDKGRTAIRRLILIYTAMGRVAAGIEQARERTAQRGPGHFDDALDILAARVSEQLATAANAIDEWRDIAPADVEELERRARATGGGEVDDH